MLVDVPFCFDHHYHFGLYLALRGCPSLENAHTGREALELISGLPWDRPNLVVGWHTDRFALDAALLDGLPPVAVLNFCLHGYAMNTGAASMAAGAGFPLIPSTAHDAERLMPGVLEFFGAHVPRVPGAAEGFMSELREDGLYGVDDMLFIPGFETPPDSGFLVETWATPAAWERFAGGSARRFRGIKLFADGAVGARTAAIGSRYVGTGEPVLIYDDETLLRAVCEAFEMMPVEGLLAVHAIGDVAVGQVLDAVGRAAAMPGMPSGLPGRVRLEHVQFITHAQAIRAAEMGVTLSMQPIFNSDSVFYLDRLDAATAAANNPFRMLIDEAGFVPGVNLLLGSDGMPRGIVPALREGLFPPHESQYLSLDEILAGYSADRRYGSIWVRIDEKAATVSMVEPDRM